MVGGSKVAQNFRDKLHERLQPEPVGINYEL